MALFITTPIFYPNDVPHLGTIYPALAADIRSRWERLGGTDTFFLTGTDEHGKKIELAARENKMAPRDFVDGLAEQFKLTFRSLAIEYDRFIRTTDEDHYQVVQHVLQAIYDSGDIYPGSYSGLYCVDCEAYYSEEDLENGDCPFHYKPVDVIEEDCYYFRLLKYKEWLLEYHETHPHFVAPPSRRNEVIQMVKGLKDDLCISRSTFRWGIPLPFDEKHVTYVWFDALLNYLTGAGYLRDPDRFKSLWPNVVHVVGKDIIRFHAIIWPAILKAAGLELPRRIFAHGFWTVNGRKFSKSLGNVILPEYLVGKYGLDPLRYYLFRETNFGADGDFSESNLVERNNSELANGLGNLLLRTTSMIIKYRDGVIPRFRKTEEVEREIATAAEVVANDAAKALEAFDYRKALETIWNLVHKLNEYISQRAPWSLHKQGEEQLLDSALATPAEGLRFLCVLVYPFMPGTGQKIAEQLGLSGVPPLSSLKWGETLSQSKVLRADPLFEILAPFVEPVPPPIEHYADSEVLNLGIRYCIAQINNLKIKKEAATVEQAKRKVEREILSKGPEWAREIPEAQGYYELYARIGKKPGEILSPIDSLSRYIFDTELGRIPQINVVVDLYNVSCLKSFLSIGAHDREKLHGGIRLSRAREAQAYIPLGAISPVEVQPGEYYWRDDEHVLCRLDIKQAEATKIDENTRHAVLIVQCHSAIPEKVLGEETERLCREIVEVCGGTYTILGGLC